MNTVKAIIESYMHNLARLAAHNTLAHYSGEATKEDIEKITEIVDNLSKEFADRLNKAVGARIEEIIKKAKEE